MRNASAAKRCDDFEQDGFARDQCEIVVAPNLVQQFGPELQELRSLNERRIRQAHALACEIRKPIAFRRDDDLARPVCAKALGMCDACGPERHAASLVTPFGCADPLDEIAVQDHAE